MASAMRRLLLPLLLLAGLAWPAVGSAKADPGAAAPAAASMGAASQPGKGFVLEDDFERADARSLGSGWTNCNDVQPDDFEPLGIVDGGLRIADPYTRPGVYDQTPPSAHPPKDNRLYPGIGCAFVDTHSTTVAVKILWSGNHGLAHPPPVSHVEATPLLYISPGNPKFGFGAWISELYGKPIIFVGYIGAPVELFQVVGSALLPGGHVPGTTREVELRAEQPGQVTIWVDGEQVSFGNAQGLRPFQVDPDMVDSTLHGVALDAHFVNPPTEIVRLKGIESVSIRSLDR